uniref:Transporter n=1 Tax=Macrostomum lignano TaxID=282301 RepID=A0A1I8HRM8_9PLAT
MAEKDRNDGDKPRNASNSADTADEKLLKNSRGSAEEATDESDGPATPVHPGYVAGAIYQSDEKVYNPEETQPFAVANQELGPVAAAAAAAAMATSNSNAADPQSNVEAGDLPVDAAQQGRAAWGGKVEFFLTAIGYAVGLGNVWRFPYLCYKNGGGAFLLPYCLMLALVGLPCFFLELSFGQFASLGPLTIWRCLFYLVHSFQARLPWESCDESWRSGLCREYRSPGESENATEAISYGGAYWNFTGELECSFNSTNVSTKCRAPSEEFYERYVLRLTSSIEDYGDFNWRLAIALFIAWIVVTLVLIKGIQSLGKVSYFTAIFPYLMLTAMLIRGATLPGALQGVLFYVKPKWGRLLDYKVWMEAATQIFFSLSCCNGGLIAMSSYNKFRNNCQRDAVIVALINCATSVFAGFVIFCNLGFMAHKKNVRVEDVAKGGPGLAFVVYPEALTHMPLSPLWAVLFFIMMATLGFGSQVNFRRTHRRPVLCAFQDELRAMGVMGASKKHAVIYRVIVCSFLFLLGLTMCFGGGMYLLNLVDNAVSTFPLLVCCIVELVVLMYIYPYKQLAEDIRLMVGGKPNIYWRATWVVITPLVMVILIILMAVFNEPITYGTYKYSPPFQLLCVLIGLFIIAWIPALAIYRYCREGGWILLREFLKPVEDWGPAKPKHRSQFLNNLAQESTEGPAAFFQSKLSIAAEMQRAASK